jgi:hypothetical protein
MTSERIKELQQTTAYPESRSVMLALQQVWNECAQENTELLKQNEALVECLKEAIELSLKVQSPSTTALNFRNKANELLNTLNK